MSSLPVTRVISLRDTQHIRQLPSQTDSSSARNRPHVFEVAFSSPAESILFQVAAHTLCLCTFPPLTLSFCCLYFRRTRNTNVTGGCLPSTNYYPSFAKPTCGQTRRTRRPCLHRPIANANSANCTIWSGSDKNSISSRSSLPLRTPSTTQTPAHPCAFYP